MTETVAAEIHRQDRRRVVNAEATRGREATIAEARAVADLGARNAALIVIAIRGERLALVRSRFSGRDQRPEAFNTESLCVVEIDRDEVVAEHIMFDPEDIDAAFEELDARYLAGEAAAHSHTWSVIANAYAALNRRELPPRTPNWLNVDHRRMTMLAPGDLTADARAAWDVTPNVTYYLEAIHQLSNLGAVITHAAVRTSHDGFDAEWRGIDLLTVEGDLINRYESFDETDLDTALARFDELSRPAQQLGNSASRVNERVLAHFNRPRMGRHG